MTAKNKYIRKPQNVRQVLAEQINILRNKKTLNKQEIEKARAIGYLCSIALTSIRDGEMESRIKALEEQEYE
ncbi:hypothetical protein [Alkalicoccus luteus]|uniref:Uncharacterized protein n=1 Tax=Alkalicoccus luteus TaxID=1237094 RepID=A0A969PWX1_9BACI|nr:hypothetical protein [Alkalicoccus luteus]NJP39378.1 hypothetical protein [Alkalicoccus luteus]